MTTPRAVLVAVVLAATTAFVVGVVLERHETTNEASESAAHKAARNAEGGEHSEGGAGDEHDEARENAENGNEPQTSTTNAPRGSAVATREKSREASEKLFGVNPESTGLVALAVAVSLVLALGVWRAGASPVMLGVVALVMAMFGALDIRELIHQADEARTGLTIVAGVVAALHLTAAAIASRRSSITLAHRNRP